VERALLVFDDIKQFVQTSKVIKSKPFKNVVEGTGDVFMKCKLCVFKTVAAECEPFLRKFQSPEPFVCFLYSELLNLLRNLMTRCVKQSSMKAADSAVKLLALDLTANENLLELRKVDIGFQTEKLLKEVKASDKDKLAFRLECRNFLLGTIKKIVERSPLKYKLVRALSALDPSLQQKNPELAQTRMKCILQTLHEHNRISDSLAEKAKCQFRSFCTEIQGSLAVDFREYEEKMGSIRLDDFFAKVMSKKQEYSDLWHVVKLCLILSHGNASVEGGFSVNKTLIVENQIEDSLVAQRRVHDAIVYYGSVESVPIDRRMLLSVRSARRRYDEYLEQKRIQSTEESKIKGEKRKLSAEVKKLEAKKKQMELCYKQEQDAVVQQIQELKAKQNSV
jgi:hypothetical protein